MKTTLVMKNTVISFYLMHMHQNLMGSVAQKEFCLKCCLAQILTLIT